MAGTASKKKAGGATKAAAKRKSPGSPAQQSPGDYAREAMTEWRKAAQFGAAALLASGAKGPEKKSGDKPPLKERLNPATTEKGGRIGDAADNVLSKLGFLGRAASKLSLGSRTVDKVLPDTVTKLQPSGEAGDGEGGAPSEHPPVPIQESIDLAAPIGAVWALATRFEDHPQWSDRIQSAEESDDTHVAFELKVLGVPREMEIEITEEQPEWRLEWEATEGIEHGGMLTLHELAPSLTRVELSIDTEPEGMVERLGRTIHLPERAIRTELHRFKAWAELWQEVEDIEPPEEQEPEEAEEPAEPEDEFEEEPQDEEEEEEPEDEEFEDEPEDDEEFEDEPEDEFEDDEDFEDEEYEDEDELEEGEPAEAR